MPLTRRRFLQASALAGATLAGPRLSFAAGSRPRGPADTVVVIFLRGGMDPLQAVPPWGDPDYYRQRPTIAIPRPGEGAQAALPLDNFFGLHPALAPIEPLYRAGQLAIVHATGLRHPDRSHFECQDHIESGLHGLADDGGGGHGDHGSGWMNRHMQSVSAPGDFYGVGMGVALQKALSGSVPALAMPDIASFAFSTSSSRKTGLEDLLYSMHGADTGIAGSARQALDAVDYLALANPSQYGVANGAAYPAGTFGQQMREVAQLIKARIGLRLACVDFGSWDHHADIGGRLPPMLDQLARAMAAFNTDLGLGMADVTVVAVTEFGRRVAENASGGTDHGCGSLMFLLGGGVIGGQVYSHWPGLANDRLYNGDLDPTIDYRSVLSELVHKRLGNPDRETLFPGLALERIGCFRKERIETVRGYG